jgi:hypothetical protein
MSDNTSSGSPSGPLGAPKLIVDSDWKSQAQAEKEKLAAKEREKEEARAKAKAAAGAMPGAGMGAGAPGPDGYEELPPASFQALLGTMVTQCLMYMGAFPDPETGRAIVSLEHAKFHIDLLAVLQDKTKGNLQPDEADAINQVVSELRLRYVDISKAVAKHMADRAAGKGGPTGGMGAMPGPGPAGPKLTF